MRKQIAILSLLLIISTGQTVDYQITNSYKIENQLRDFRVTQNNDFALLANSKEAYNFFNREGLVERKKPSGRSTSFAIDYRKSENSLKWLSGSKFGNSKWRIFSSEGKVITESGFPISVARSDFIGDNKVLIGNSHYYALYHENRSKIWRRNHGAGHLSFEEEADIDDDGNLEKPLGSHNIPQGGRLNLVELKSGKIEWRTSKESGGIRGKVIKDRILTYSNNQLTLRSSENNILWQKRIEVKRPNIVALSDSVVYSTSDHLLFRNLENGNIIKKIPINSEIEGLKKYPSREMLVGYHRGNLSFFNFEGNKVASVNVGNLHRRFQLTNYDDDPEYEIAFGREKRVDIIDIELKDEKGISHSMNETVFVGNGKGMLKAVALNQTAFVTDSYSEVEKAVEETGLKIVSVGINGPNRTEDLNSAFNTSKPKYFPGSREKAVYISALAARRNASLTFEKSESDRDFSNYTLEELQQIFIQKFEPNHIVTTDLDSDKGTLAAYMAVKQGVLPVNFDHETDYSDFGEKNAREVNRYNGVISLDHKIDQEFAQIGENRETIFDGRYVSLLDAPRKVFRDPVEKGIFDDPADGNYYTTDLGYGDLDQDGLLEAGVGRYPEDLSQASLVFHRSMNRKSDKRATLASEYLHSKWPVILTTFGGGMRYGKAVETSLKQEGFDTVHLVEYRSDPVGLMMDLAPAGISGFMDSTEKLENQLKRVISDSAAHSIKNALVAVKAMKYTESILEMYYEFQWHDYSFSIERARERTDQLRIPKGMSAGEIIQKSVLETIYVIFWPDRQPRLTEGSLRENISKADIVYYGGVGNSTSWTLPNNDSSYLKNRYTGENRIEPEEIPELEDSIIWDNSNNAGVMDGEMRETLIEKGASSYLGFSTVNYGSYSSVVANNFFRYGETLGNSQIKGVNALRKAELIYNPASSYRTGVRQKMSSSLRLYGNPEMDKDPLEQNNFNISRSCEDHLCRITAELETDYNISELNGSRTVEFGADSYLLEPGAPITPLYSYRYELPVNSEIQKVETSSNYSSMDNVYVPRTDLLSHGNRHINSTRNYTAFPEKLSNTSTDSGEVKFVQAALQDRPNKTLVLEEAKLRIEYRTPATAELEKSGEMVVVAVRSKKQFEADLVSRLNGEKQSRTVEIKEGLNRFNLGKLAEGINTAEVYVVDNKIAAKDSENPKLAANPKVTLFAPDIHREDVRKIKAVVENPNSFGVNETLKLKTGEKVQLGMLEDSKKHINLDPGERKTVSWRFTGIETGNSSASLEGNSANISVYPARNFERKITSQKISKLTGSPYRQLKQSRKDSELKLVLKTEIGQVKYIKTSEYEYSSLKTDDYRAELNKTPDMITRKVSKPTGRFLKQTSKFGSVSRGLLSEKEVSKVLSALEKETGKLREAYISGKRRE